MHVLHREDTRSAVIADRRRNDEALETGDLFAQSEKIVRLLAIIELAQKALAKLLEHLPELVAFSKLGVLVEKIGDFLERFEILHHRLANAGTLHFYGDTLAAAQHCAMHLA